MCGIAGFVSKKVNNKEVILRMNAAMIHRGPDSGDIFIDESTGVTLGHRRLAIVDLNSTGAQPMISHDGRYVIVYNGEIYNAAAIRSRLEQEYVGIQWRGTSDTEVLVESIARLGIRQTLEQATGMFAFAVYDKVSGSITVARDRIGEKPLYYGHINGDFVFASDLGELEEYPGFVKRLSMEAVRLYLRYSYVPTPLSIYEGIFKLKPGTFMRFEAPYEEGVPEVYYDTQLQYIDGLNNQFAGSYEEAVDSLESVLKKAIRSQLMSDVPLGAFLSGGIDSATIVALMQSLGEGQTKTFTIGFEEKEYDEAEAAASIAKHLGTDHTSLTISERELKEIIPKLPSIFTEPMADSSELPTYLVSKLARSKVTVSLSGDAGDELFAGYNTYWKTARLYNKVKRVPYTLRKTAGSLLVSGAQGLNPLARNNKLYRAGNCLRAKDIAEFHESVSYDMTYLSGKHISQTSLLDKKGTIEDEMMLRDLLHYHPDDILVKVDRAGMAVSLENRVPMLDKDVLKLAYSLPLEYKLSMVDGKLVSKRILKDVLYRYVPKELMDRPKKGFSVPLKKWLSEGEIYNWSRELLCNSKLQEDGILDKDFIEKVVRSFDIKGENKGLLWNLVVLEQWYREHG